LITCDTHALVFWSLAPDRLSPQAAATIEQGRDNSSLACADIVLWEIAMLAAKGRIVLPLPTEQYLRDVITAMRLKILPITPEIAVRAQDSAFVHGDPADRLIAATALVYGAPLVSADTNLAQVASLEVIW
jgi:PIN domain nuclease of toxin-antitoxin system